MKKLIVLTFALTFAILSFAQGKLNGRVVDENGKTMEFVTVTLHRAKDSALVKGAITDMDGKYEFLDLKNGAYIVAAQQVGYKKSFSSTIEIKDNALNFNDLKLSTDVKTLSAVTITAQKPFIEHQIDKTVVNVENSAVAAGSTAMEVLEKAPGVIVDNEGKIQLRGKDGVRIMIDGKPSQLSQDQLANLLRNTNSNLIQKIEIITNPSAKYDAAGNAGIINIVMKKNQLYGTNGQVTSTYGQGVYFKTFNSLNLNYRYGKWNLFGSYNYSNRKNFNENNLTRIFRADNGKGAITDSFVQTAYQLNPFISHNWRAGVDYNISNKTTVGILANGTLVSRNLNTQSNINNITTIYAPDGTIRSVAQTLTQPRDKWNDFSGNFNIKHTFDSLGREITFDLDYYKYSSDDNQSIQIINKGETNQNQLNDIRGRFDIKTAKFDYTLPFNKTAKLDFGAKTSFVESDNDIKFFNVINSTPVSDPNITNNFIYNENINAAYLNWNQELKKGISYQLGLRAENTNIKGQQVTQDTSFTRHYTNVFPTAFVMKKWGAKDKHALRLSYSYRIDRPNYQDLNPFRFFLDKYTFQQGNPNLTPQFTHGVDVNYTFMGAMSIGLNYAKTNDAITFVLKQDDATKRTFVTNENLATKENYGVALSVPVPIKKWWMMSNSVNFFVNRYQGEYLGAFLDLKIPVLNLNIQNRFTLKNDWSAELSAWYVSQANQGLFVGDPMYAVNAGISKQLLDRRLTIRLNAQDIFRTQRFKGGQKYQNLDITMQSRWDSQQVRLTASYRFGNQKVQQARRRNTGAEDEKNRVNKSN